METHIRRQPHRKHIHLIRVFLFLSVFAAAASCRPPAKDYAIEFTDTIIENGLRVILSEDHSAPTYSIAVTYNVGSRDEKPGRSGFAHLFEHMMFQGSENIGKGEHFSLIDNNGGSTNGDTTSDRTMYYETLPANQIDLGLFLESDRMRSLAITEGNFRNQLETVKEERRERYDNQPYGRTYEVAMDTAYDNYAYKHIAIGSMKDLNASTVDDARSFFKTYYAPNNAVLTMVGDFKTSEVLTKIRKAFEDIPRQPPPPEPDMTEPAQTSERRRVFEDELADLTQIDIMFKTPQGNTPEYYALDVAAFILAGGRSSRLYQKMVKDKQVAQEVSAYADERRGPGVFALSAMVRPEKNAKEVEQLLYEELERLQTELVKESEMEKVQMQVKSYITGARESTMDRAKALGFFTVFYQDPNLINSLSTKYAAVTREQIQEVAKRFFNENNRTVITTVPKGATGPAAAEESASKETSRVELKKKAPVSKDLLRVNIPRPREYKLSNGVTVLITEDHRLPLVSIQYNIGAAGPIFEPRELPGLANITAQMMTEGTTSRTSLEIAEAVESLGAALSVSSGYGSSVFVVSASGLSDNFEKWFALANDVLLHPSFPADELDRLKQRLRIALRQQRTDPDFLANERFSRVIYGDHPAATVTTTAAAIDAITPERLATWRNERLTPQNTILGIAGDVDPKALIPKLESALAQWKRTDLQESPAPNPKPAVKRAVYIVDRPGATQTNLYMGNIAIDRRSADYFPVLVANQVFGATGSARLFTKLREEKGYTYGAYSWFVARKYPGPWMAAGNNRNDVTGDAMAEFLSEIDRLRGEPVTDAEMDDARRAIIASFALSLESKDDLLSYAITQKIFGLPEDYWQTYPEKVNTITTVDVQRVARQYLDPSALQIVAVGSAKAITPAMKAYGTIETYDVDGKRIGR